MGCYQERLYRQKPEDRQLYFPARCGLAKRGELFRYRVGRTVLVIYGEREGHMAWRQRREYYLFRVVQKSFSQWRLALCRPFGPCSYGILVPSIFPKNFFRYSQYGQRLSIQRPSQMVSEVTPHLRLQVSETVAGRHHAGHHQRDILNHRTSFRFQH